MQSSSISEIGGNRCRTLIQVSFKISRFEEINSLTGIVTYA